MTAAETPMPLSTPVEVGDLVRVGGRSERRQIDCWFASPHLTDALLDPEWTSPPPGHANLPPKQRVTIVAKLASPAWVNPEVKGPWFLAEFTVAQQTWQTAIAQADLVIGNQAH